MTQDVFPEGTCACGQDLASAADLGVKYSHQVTDLPDARAPTTQYDRHEVACPCNRRHVADAPPLRSAATPGYRRFPTYRFARHVNDRANQTVGRYGHVI